MSKDKFLQRLRDDARMLQYEPADEVVINRIAARIRDRVARPGVADLLARWFRPVATSLAALALAGAVAIGIVEQRDETPVYDTAIEISVAGESYRVE